jgi:hypothetical protein
MTSPLPLPAVRTNTEDTAGQLDGFIGRDTGAVQRFYQVDVLLIRRSSVGVVSYGNQDVGLARVTHRVVSVVPTRVE